MTSCLAMHMANELLDVRVAAMTLAVAAAAVAVAAARARRTTQADKLPLMGVMGAFVFAAQMINFALPGMPGTSGHLGGGVLLAILLGPAAGIITMTSILIIQCLIFQDGGLLALGCNVINMGVVPCLAGWWLYRRVLGKAEIAPAWRQYLSAWAACLVGVTLGAALVPVETSLAGRLVIPMSHFLAVMVGVHLIIAAMEGLITFAVLAYLRKVHPAYIGLRCATAGQAGLSRKAVALSLIATAALLAGVVSWFASPYSDGLEWSYLEHRYGGAPKATRQPTAAVNAVDELQSKYTPMPDYTVRSRSSGATEAAAIEEADQEAWPGVNGWTTLAGLVGTVLALLVVYLVSRLLGRKARAGERAPTAPV